MNGAHSLLQLLTDTDVAVCFTGPYSGGSIATPGPNPFEVVV